MDLSKETRGVGAVFTGRRGAGAVDDACTDETTRAQFNAFVAALYEEARESVRERLVDRTTGERVYSPVLSGIDEAAVRAFERVCVHTARAAARRMCANERVARFACDLVSSRSYLRMTYPDREDIEEADVDKFVCTVTGHALSRGARYDIVVEDKQGAVERRYTTYSDMRYAYVMRSLFALSRVRRNVADACTERATRLEPMGGGATGDDAYNRLVDEPAWRARQWAQWHGILRSVKTVT